MKTLIMRVVATAVIITAAQMLLPKTSVGNTAKRFMLLIRTVMILEPVAELLSR